MSSLLDWLKEQAAKQLDSATPKVEDGKWFDRLMDVLENQVSDANLDSNIDSACMEAINKLNENKELLVGLGSHAFGLLLLQITSGRDQDAMETYIRALSNADDLIALMKKGTDGVIKAKMELDALHRDAKKLALDLLTTGIRYLLPFLLGLL